MKKSTIYKILTVILLPVIYFLLVTGYKGATENSSKTTDFLPTSNNGKNFENVIFNFDSTQVSIPPIDPTEWIPWQITNYKGALNFTGVQSYEFGSDNFGIPEFSLTEQQATNIAGLSSIVTSNGLDFYFHRPNIANPCYGQRVVFVVTPPPGNNTDSDGFCFSSTGGVYTTDEGRNVLHATPGQEYPTGYWLAKNIYENKAFTNFDDFGHGARGTWYIKPMMRIDSSVVDNYPELPVVRIDIHNYDDNQETGTPIKSITIKAKHFAQNLAGTLYGGQYIDIYNFIQDPQFDLTVTGGDGSQHTPHQLNDGVPIWTKNPICGYFRPWHTNCHVDFQIYWLGQVECWFEKMTVDEEVANKLFNPDTSVNYDHLIRDEVTKTGNDGFTYYVDEITTSDVPCLKYVKDKMHEYNPNAQLLSATNYCWDVRGNRSETLFSKHYLQTIQPPTIELNMVDAFEIFPGTLPEGVLSNYDRRIPNSWFGSRDNYTRYVQNNVFGDRNSRTPSDQWDYSNWLIPSPAGSDVYDIEHEQEQIRQYSPNTKLMAQGQIHAYMHVDHNTGYFDGMLSREPLDEEIEAQLGIFLAHGVGATCWFGYQSMEWFASFPMNLHFRLDNPADAGDSAICFGLTAVNNGQGGRTENCYNQNKWAFMSQLNGKIMAWKPILDNTTWQDGWSVQSETANHNYISDIESIIPGNIMTNCNHDNHYIECPESSYWEMGFYNPPSGSNSKYLFMLNRRTIPQTSLYEGDNRILKILFNPSRLFKYNTWKISDVLNPSIGITFNKYSNTYIDLGSSEGSMGYFKPGEGRLFKLEPVMASGGNLLADEIIDGSETISDTVRSNGHSITINNGANISFTDSATIVMNGGTFTMGNAQQQGAPDISMGPVSGNTFHGLTFQNASVNIFNTSFGNLKNDINAYVITCIDCPTIDIRNNSFTFNGQSMNGAISITQYDNTVTPNIYIGGNSFTTDVSTLPAISLMSYAGITDPALIENNIFNSNETIGSYNILLSGITGAVVKSNSFTNSDRALSCLSSSIDFAENTVSSTISGSKSVECLSGSEVRMTRSGAYFLGGLNTINNTGTNSDNIYLENSDFLLDQGQNIFNIADNTSCNHLKGYFPALLPVSTSEVLNCFKVNNAPVDPPVETVTLGNGGNNVLFTFTPYLPECSTGGGLNGFAVIGLGNNIFDTVLQYNGGGGGQRNTFDLQNAKRMNDSISIQMRYRNYNYIKSKCMELINAYPDSLQSLNAISKLYLATSATDTTHAGLTALKTYYENLILNNGDNPSLVSRCFYYIQKCKVLLHDYTGAMQGFQTIMNNNPYTYEGLIASWDFMVTSLLMNGHGGGEEPVEQIYGTTDPTVEQTFLSVHDYDDGPKDKSPWNKEQRKEIRKSINNSILTTRNEQEKQIETLTKQSKEGNEDAKIQLKVANTLKDIVKSRKPNSILEHIKMVSNDIQKIVSTAAGRKPNKVTNNIPTVFSLSQNFPNPFNPTTTIKYALPKDVKVTIKIYDILGKLVITLVNGELKKAGYYEAQFDGTNFASGVYFYRIEAVEFVQSKKMVLVK